jgi:branched-chain amino acid transport system ATP-binding protein
MSIEKPLLVVQGLAAGYGRKRVLQGIDITVEAGEVVAVVGRNGMGKTTLMLGLMGLIPTGDGRITYRGRDVTRLPPESRAHIGFGYVPQGRQVFPRMSVVENLAVGRLINRGRSDRMRDELVYEYFPILWERRHQRAGTLSGGEQQQLAIGRALIGDPDLVLLDEPSEGIQPSIIQLIMQVMLQINRELGKTILFVEQNLEVITNVAQRCYTIDKGRITTELPPEKLRDPDVLSRHLVI